MIYDEQTYQLIHDYLNGNLDAYENKAFEIRMHDEPSFAEEVKISKDMFANLGEEGWEPSKNADVSKLKGYRDFLSSQEGVDYANAIQTAQSQYEEKKVKWTIKPFLLAAASASLILISTLIYFQTAPDKELDSFYSWNDLPSLTERSEDNTSLATAEQLFIAEKYDKALEILLLSLDSTGADVNTYIYTGICLLELERNEEALNTFKRLSQSDLLDKGKANWYMALTYLKVGEKDKAQQQLNEILSDQNNFFYQEAQELSVLID